MPTERNSSLQNFRESSPTGLVLLDRTGRPVYFNPDAISVLTYPRRSEPNKSLLNALPTEIQRTLAGALAGSGKSHDVEFISGRRRYLCRLFSLTHNSRHPGKVTIALVIERVVSKTAQVAEMAAHFHLTEREQQTVGFLADGLSSKEIANRMKISPNTVKTFMRLIMTKMSVPTRSGIIGKMLQT
jgi:DNA-binding CsgD family transcriptional regulator